MVVGVAGAGKSTLVNELIRYCHRMQEGQPSEPEGVVIQDDVFSEAGSITSRSSEARRQAAPPNPNPDH